MQIEIQNDDKKNRLITGDVQDLMMELRNFKSYKNIILNPFDLDNMKEGIELLNKNIVEKKNIFIQVDSDVDGLTSAALTYLIIKQLDSDANVQYRLHPDKTHGIKMGSIPEDTNLIIMPDASSNEIDKHKHYADKGIDILVLDHHEAEEYSPYACVINNQMSKNYDNKNLSGVGVVGKFFEGFFDYYEIKSFIQDYYDLIAVGMIADSMNINNSESMFYIDSGLKDIRNPMISYMAEKNFYIPDNTSITAKDVSWSIAPLLNAVFRMGTERDRELMFQAFIDPYSFVQSKKRNASPSDKVQCIEESYRLCTNARSRQNGAVIKALKYMEENNRIISKDNIVVVLLSEKIMARELSGLVAMKISDKHQKPTVVLMEDKNGNYSGSGRTIDDSISFRDFIEDSDKAIFAQGHASAFGVSFDEKENIDDFIEYADKNYQTKESKIVVDFKINMDDITAELAEKINSLKKYYGKGFDALTFYIEDFTLPKDIKIRGKYQDVVNMRYKDMELIRFKDRGLADAILGSKKDLILDIIGEIEVNEWEGTRTPQLSIKQYEIKGEKFSF